MVLRPVGPNPAAVYWRRRVVLLAVVIIVIVILVRACSGSGTGTPTAGAHHARTRPTTSTTAAVTPCTHSELTAAVTPRPAAAAAGSAVHFSGVLSNTGTVTCLLQVTPSQLVWTVRSGKVTVWSCPSAFTAQQPLAPHASVAVKSISWHGKVSAPPSCSGTTTATPGAYSVRLRLGRTRSPATAFTLH